MHSWNATQHGHFTIVGMIQLTMTMTVLKISFIAAPAIACSRHQSLAAGFLSPLSLVLGN